MANVLGELFQDIADAIRSKTGSTDTLKPNQFPAAIEGITAGGGGSSADVRYVTFMNGTEVLYKKAVAVGDDCVDVLTKGLISTPTKESTAQYNYTYYGWGASDGGAADANILKNITEDKTVYAIFTATVRYYTVTYLDDDGATVLHTEQLAYGAIPSYAPTKAGYIVSGWTPAIESVSGDASYVVGWKQGYSFATSSWDEIAMISEAGDASKYFAVGDKRTEYIDANTGTTTFVIMGFDHDQLSDGTGKAGITIGMESDSVGSTTATGYFETSINSESFAGYKHKKQVTKSYMEKGEIKTSNATTFSFTATELGMTINSMYGDNYNEDGSATYEAVTRGLYYKNSSSGFWLKGNANNNYYIFSKNGASGWTNNTSAKYKRRLGFCI